MLRARPPRDSCASSSRTDAPPSAAVIAAVSPAIPPPTIVIRLIAPSLSSSLLSSSFFADTAKKEELSILGNDGRGRLAPHTVPVMAPPGGPVSPTLLVELDREADVPLHEQIERSIREGVRSGRLGPESQLPSTRG